LTREQLERAAQLAQRPDDAYAQRWALIHERIAEAVVRRELSRKS
jgi:hypothetical protein